MTFIDACAAALAQSELHQCTVHVNSRVVVRDGWPCIDRSGFSVSDWYCDGSTVKTYTEGKEDRD